MKNEKKKWGIFMSKAFHRSNLLTYLLINQCVPKKIFNDRLFGEK